MPSKTPPKSSARPSGKSQASSRRNRKKKEKLDLMKLSPESGSCSRSSSRSQRGSPRRLHAQSEGFRSAFEFDIAQELDSYGVHWEYETVVIPWQPQPKKYVPDFKLENGVIVECKGKFDADDRAKHLNVREQHPELDIRILFQNAHNKLRKGAKMTYGEWCDKHGIPWANKHIPKEWLK